MNKKVLKACLVWILCGALAFTGPLTGMTLEARAEGETAAENTAEEPADAFVTDGEETAPEEVTEEIEEETPEETVEDGTEEVSGEETEEEIEEASEEETEEITPAEEETAEAERQNAGEEEEPKEEKEAVPTVKYRTSVKGAGWGAITVDGATSGTTGSAQIEKIKLIVKDFDEKYAGSGVSYSGYIQGSGWVSEVSSWQQLGYGGKRLEAVKISLTGPIKDDYSIYYRVYVEGYGWLGWTKDGRKAGSSSYDKKMQGIQIKLVKKGEEAPDTSAESYKCPLVLYRAYTAKGSWQDKVTNGKKAGSTNKSGRMIALQAELPDPAGVTGHSGSIQYNLYVQGSGWQGWVKNGATGGTTAKSKFLTAVRVKLTGGIADYYDVYYSVFMKGIGWSGYAKNAEKCGTLGLGKMIEGIKIKLVKKGEEAPETPGAAFVQGFKPSSFKYSGKTHNGSMTAKKKQGTKLGGKSGLDGVKLSLTKSDSDNPDGKIKIRVHTTSSGWSGWKNQGDYAGIESGSQFVDAVQVKLTGDLADYYDVYYQTKVENHGWLGWAKNGQTAGSTKIDYKLQGLKIRLVSKDMKAPGKNADYYTERKFKPGPDLNMWARANWYSSPTDYIVLVDRAAHRVGIFKGGKGYWECVHSWKCGNGKDSTPTPTGVFSIQSKGYYFDSGRFRCFWYSQFYGNYLFHTVLCWPDGSIADGRVGMALSHGCVRLRKENAKWLYDNVPYGSKVVIYN